MKKALGDVSKEDHKFTVENFVMSVFAKTDKDERICEKITKQNAIDFKRCADFIQLLTIFGELDADWKEREKYCKYKAATIVKCLKSGEEPQRGNPFAPEEEKLPHEGEMDIEESKDIPSEYS